MTECDHVQFDETTHKVKNKVCGHCSGEIQSIPYFTPMGSHSTRDRDGPGSGHGLHFSEIDTVQDTRDHHSYYHRECASEFTDAGAHGTAAAVHDKKLTRISRYTPNLGKNKHLEDEVKHVYSVFRAKSDLSRYGQKTIENVMNMSKMSAFDEGLVNIVPRAILYMEGGYKKKPTIDNPLNPAKDTTSLGRHIVRIELVDEMYGRGIPRISGHIRERLPMQGNVVDEDPVAIKKIATFRKQAFNAIYNKLVFKVGNAGVQITLAQNEDNLANEGTTNTKPICTWDKNFVQRPLERRKSTPQAPEAYKSLCNDIDLDTLSFGLFVEGGLAGMMELDITNESAEHGNVLMPMKKGGRGRAMRCLYVKHVAMTPEYGGNCLARYMLWFAREFAMKLNQHPEVVEPSGTDRIHRVYFLTQEKNRGMQIAAEANDFKLKKVSVRHHSFKYYFDLPEEQHGPARPTLFTGTPFPYNPEFPNCISQHEYENIGNTPGGKRSKKQTKRTSRQTPVDTFIGVAKPKRGRKKKS